MSQRIVVLISGRGSNLAAILAAGLPVCAVITNNPDASGLALAHSRQIPTVALRQVDFADRLSFDMALRDAIDPFQPDLVVLAGYMRILSDVFVQHYAGRLINIHPSLLPAYPGLHTHRHVLADGVRIHGCTVHFVTPKLDHGPIIVQAAVQVKSDDTEDILASRVLVAEHRVLPEAIRWFLQDRLHITSEGIVCLSKADRTEQSKLFHED